jgi:hypothetical protein
VGYWGTIVLARCDMPLPWMEGIFRFGQRHRWLREAQDGWQILETARSIEDPPDLAAAALALTSETDAPVLAAYVCDGDCAGVYGATSSGASWSAHLPDPTAPCTVFQHRPGFGTGQPVPTAVTARRRHRR